MIENKTQNNLLLNKATVSKKDEFYTTYEDIQLELQNYGNYFTGKTVYCSCDNPYVSNFFKYFVDNFNKLKLKKLIATCYISSPVLDEMHSNAYQAVITVVDDSAQSLDELFASSGNSIQLFSGDGDFRSKESVDLLKEADVIVTNPPFSLFRPFVNQLQEYGKDFLILGNMNAVTYKEVFPLFRDNKIWYGESIRSGDRKFYVPDDYPFNAAGYGTDEVTGKRFIRVKGIRWFTNLENNRRHEPIELTKEYDSLIFPKYENYDAINVSKTLDIPKDYDGVMGVPITFLDRYNPDQFEIMMLANGNARTNVLPDILDEVGYQPHNDDKGGVGIVDGKRVYVRILVRLKNKNTN